MLAGDSNRIVYASSPLGDENRTLLMSLDLSTGHRSVVAHSSFETGTIGEVGVSGEWTAFVEQSAIQGDDQQDVLWRVVATNGNKQVVLETNASKPDPFVPTLRSSHGMVFWSSADADRSAREWLWRSGWPVSRSLLRHARLAPGTETVNGDSKVFLGDPAQPNGVLRTGGDCWTVSWSGGRPKPLTHSGMAMGCAADGTWLVWQEHIDPKTIPAPDEGMLDDPYEIWGERIGGRPELLHRGYTAGTWPMVVDGMALWADDSGEVILQDLSNPLATTDLGESDPRQLAVVLGDKLGLPRLVGSGAAGAVELVKVGRG